MPRFFVDNEAISGDGSKILLTGENAHHISHSLRMREGEEITVCDMRRREYRCRLSTFHSDRVEAEVLAADDCRNEPPYSLTLFMALPKSDKMEWIIQKSVELGVSEIVPVRTERCIVKLDEKDGEKKRQRWQKIADAAAGQCGRGILPTVRSPMEYADALTGASEAGLPIFCYEAAGEDGMGLAALLRAAGKPASISVFVGAEGGFSPAEAEAAREAGLHIITLGRRILRCETAPLFVLSAVSCLLEG